ncbi:MAG: hypothetical protein IJ746_05860 [Ruminococcus sp.]|nr:hypothetical protein [Ruminococcus sp.]
MNSMNDQNERERSSIYVSEFFTCEEEDFDARNTEEPIAELSTFIKTETVLECYPLYRKRRGVQAAVSFVLGAGILAYTLVNAASYTDLQLLYFFLAACAVLAVGVRAVILRLMQLNEIYQTLHASQAGRYEFRFYSDKLAMHATAEDGFFYKRPLALIPYSSIRRLVITDKAVALVNKHYYGIFIMRRDMPEGLLESLLEKCSGAKKIRG